MQKISGYTYIYRKSSSVNVDDLSSEMLPLLDSLEEEGKSISAENPNFGGFVITSGKDSHFGKLSYHNIGKAIDISIYDSKRQTIPGWTSENWTAFKRVMNKVNSSDSKYWYLLEGKTDLQLHKLLGLESDINSKATGAELHFHIEFNPGRAKLLSQFNVPDKEVDKIDIKSKADSFYFIYQEKDSISFRDLILNNSLFKNYLTDEGKINETKSLDLLEYKGTARVSNYERILNGLFQDGFYVVDWSVLTEDEFKEKYPSPLDLPICNGQTILLPPSESKRDFLGLLSENQVFYFDDFEAFISEKRKEIEADENYVPNIKLYGDLEKIGYSLNYQVNQVNSEFSVWIYCCSLGKIINVSKYCKSITEDSSNFTIELSYLSEDSLVESNAERSYETVNEVIMSSGFRNNTSYKSESGNTKSWRNKTRIQEGSFRGRNNPSLFQKVISQGDIIFIRFETLGIESNLDTTKCGQDNRYNLPIVSKDKLPGNCYDLIGIIDTCSQTEDFSSDDVSVVVTGTSFEGVFEKDVSMFLPIALISNNSRGNLIFSSSTGNNLMQRLFASGNFGYLWNYMSRTIEDTVKFYLNQLTNSAIVSIDDDLFSGYPDSKKSKVYDFLPKNSKKDESIQKTNAKGIYQIIKVDIDSSLKGRYISDGSVSNPNGSINNLFQKLCRWPLVEYFTDTYGDTFHIVIRKPPFDQKSLTSFLDYGEKVDYGLKGVKGFYEISSDDVELEQLSWNQEFYTWFQMDPDSIILDEESKFLFTPIIFLSEYVNKWGSRPLQFVNPYIGYPGNTGSSIFDEKSRSQIISDMIYVLESSIYLPFTRRGIITLKGGDRRIKKGTWIKYTKTNEVYYVDSVTQSASITNNSVERVTTLNVSRGMVMSYITDTKVEGINEPISYFRLANLEDYKKSLEDYSNGKFEQLEISRDLSINPVVFKFFLEGRQFSKEFSVNVGMINEEGIV